VADSLAVTNSAPAPPSSASMASGDGPMQRFAANARPLMAHERHCDAPQQFSHFRSKADIQHAAFTVPDL
jgi:hypothetical protein